LQIVTKMFSDEEKLALSLPAEGEHDSRAFV